MPIPLPGYLQALFDLTTPFSSEATLAQLRAQIDDVRALLANMPDPPAPAQAPPQPPPPHIVNAQLLTALGGIVVKPLPSTGWRRCPTPGCSNGYRWP